uniref:Uncharacterized protein n=1 Tax=Heterorhabditis bacteriophora TaxID=37862 RepID=A0A1I7XN45_HETBA
MPSFLRRIREMCFNLSCCDELKTQNETTTVIQPLPKSAVILGCESCPPKGNRCKNCNQQLNAIRAARVSLQSQRLSHEP